MLKWSHTLPKTKLCLTGVETWVVIKGLPGLTTCVNRIGVSFEASNQPEV